jgi:hypothetical protein
MRSGESHWVVGVLAFVVVLAIIVVIVVGLLLAVLPQT